MQFLFYIHLLNYWPTVLKELLWDVIPKIRKSTRCLAKFKPFLTRSYYIQSFIHFWQSILSLTVDICRLFFFFFWSSNVSLTPDRTPKEWRLQVQMLRSVKTQCGRAPSLSRPGFRAVITWEDSGIRWKPTAVSGCVCEVWKRGHKRLKDGW